MPLKIVRRRDGSIRIVKKRNGNIIVRDEYPYKLDKMSEVPGGVISISTEYEYSEASDAILEAIKNEQFDEIIESAIRLTFIDTELNQVVVSETQILDHNKNHYKKTDIFYALEDFKKERDITKLHPKRREIREIYPEGEELKENLQIFNETGQKIGSRVSVIRKLQ